MGFSKGEIGAIGNAFGLLTTILGGLIGGVVVLKMNFKKALWIFGIFQAVSTLGFAVLATVGKNNWVLTGVIAFEDIASGMGTTAFVAFMASLTNRRYTATQYALLTGLMGIPRTVISSGMGFVAEEIGWVSFFVFCTLAATPGMLLLLRFDRWQKLEAE
jgi:MFS transporter, PAT family, beta-lactamase induction signal transducer AmpG